MKINILFLALLAALLLSATVIFAQTKQVRPKKLTIAVMDFDAREGIARGEAASLSDVLSAQLVGTKEFSVVDRNRIKNILTEQGFQQSEACSQVECIVEAGKILKVEKMFAGVVGKIGRIYNVNIQVIDISTGQIEINKSYNHDGDIEELVQEIIPKLAIQIAEELTGKADLNNEPSTMFGGVKQSSPSYFSIFGGAAVPLGDFAKSISSESIIAHLNYDTPIPFTGSAKMGFTVGAQFVTGGTIGWIINGSYSQTNMDLPSEVVASGYTYKIETAGWQSILALTGVKIGTKNSPRVNFFVAPLVGVFYGKSPEILINFSQVESGYTVNASETYGSASNIAFAYGLEAQLTISKNFIIGAQYINSAPKYDLDDRVIVTINPPLSTFQNVDRTEKESTKFNTSILVVYVGYAF
jgi:TolB-like protein